MFKTIVIKLNERAAIFRNGLPIQFVGPGRHRLWGFNLSEQRFDTDMIVFRAPREVRELIPREWFQAVTLGPFERGVLFREERPELFLRPGVHRFWTVDPSIRLAVFDVREAMPPLTKELEALFPRAEYVSVTVQAHEQGLRFERGRFSAVLEPGRYDFWSHPAAEVKIVSVDTRRAEVTIAGQELMTRDKVTLRLTLTVEYAVADPALAAQAVTSARDSVYLAAQLAAREYVAGVTLDQLLEGRDALTLFLEADVRPKAERFGVRVDRIGVKDVVLPGEMKTLLNRVIEAEKEAAANVILRREETAATRSLVNTARLMADQPILLRLKELEAMKDIAGQIKDVRVVVGSDNFRALLPADFLGTVNKA